MKGSLLKHCRAWLLWAVSWAVPVLIASDGVAQPPPGVRPNVLFVAVDDLNDWVLGEDPVIRAPNLRRLASRGMLFSRAYCASPACNPSRTAVMTGRAASTTGVYGNKSDWRRAMPNVDTISQYFMQQGYKAVGSGKIFHHHGGSLYHDKASFDDFLLMPNPPDAPMPKAKLNRLKWYGSLNTDWGAWPPDEADAVDVRTVDYAIKRLAEKHDRPLFLAVGIFRPHMPFFCPQRFIDQYPLDEVTMPKLLDGDLDDIPPGGKELLRKKAWFFQGMMKADSQKAGTWREAVRCYQACATFADAQFGRVLAALDKSPYAANTIVVLWSDHGFHLGEKKHWEKFALWEKTTRVPFVVVAPGVTTPKTVCRRPVSLLDIYPTLIQLAGLPPKPDLDGVSLVPLLKDPKCRWDRPAAMTYLRGNHAVRDDRWRYIRYHDGSEELYDHKVDPNEWHNVAGDSNNAAVIERLKKWLPKKNADPVPDMGRKR